MTRPGNGGDTGTCHPCAQQKQDRRCSHPGCPPCQPSRRGCSLLSEKLECLGSVAATAVLSRLSSLASEYLARSSFGAPPWTLRSLQCFVTFHPRCLPAPGHQQPLFQRGHIQVMPENHFWN